MKTLYLFFMAIFIAGYAFGQSTSEMNTSVPLTMQCSQSDGILHIKSASIASSDLSDVKDIVYLRTGTCGNYWGMNGNATTLDNTFGAGNWTRLDFEGLDVPALLASNVKFIFIDGSNYGTCEFVDFLNTYRTELEDWVASGKSLFLNAAPNECYTTPINTITGVSLKYQPGGTAYSADNSHPVFQGPETPALASAYHGGSFYHCIVEGSDLSPILQYNNIPVLAEKDWGSGKIMFGGLTLEFFGQHSYWSPEPQVSNLYSNILQYMFDAVSPCIEDIVQDNDPGECGAVVDYDYPAEWAEATVTQIDTSGLTSGDMFPVGVTTQSYQLVWDGGSSDDELFRVKSATAVAPPAPTDTCTFTVTVNDTEAPTVTCKDTFVYIGSKYGKTSGKVLLLWDIKNSNTTSLKEAIEAEGYSVTMPSVPEYQWNNTNPSLDGFDAVIHLDGTTYVYPLPIEAQNALVDFVKVQGKTFIHTEWDAYEIDDENMQIAMKDLIILQRYSGRMDNLTYKKVTGEEDHPVLKDLPNTFTISNVAYSPSHLRNYSTDPAKILMTDQYETAAVAVREFGEGKVIGFNHAGNYSYSNALSDTNIQKLFINALNWGVNNRHSLSSMVFESGTDNCGTIHLSISKDTFTCEDVGDNTVILTATDDSGNSSTCTSTVTVIDTIPPTVYIPAEIEVDLDNLGNAEKITIAFLKLLHSIIIDDCTSAQITGISGEASTRSYTAADLGHLIPFQIEVTDESGNVTVAHSAIKVVDHVAPEPNCNPITITLREDGRYALTEEDVAALSAGTTDNADPYDSLTIEAWPKAFGCEDVSDQFQIDILATDKAGNTSRCWVYCKVIDPNELTFEPISDVEIEVDPGVCSTAVTYPEINTTSPCATVELIEGLGPDGMFPLGTTVEKWKAYNTSGDTIEISFNVTVTTTNALPTFDALSDVTVDEDSPVVNVPLTGISYGVDCIPQEITVAATSNNPELVSNITVNYTSPDATGSLDITIVPDANGTDTIEVIVSDDAGGFVSEKFVLTVNEVNDPPTINQPANVTVDEDAPVINVPLSGISGGPSSESQKVTISATGSNDALVSAIVVNYTSPDATGSLDITLAPDMNGVDSIRVTVVDSEGSSHSRTFVLTVNPVNDAPFVVNPLAEKMVNASYSLDITISSILGELFDDVDDDALTITVTLEDGSELPAWATLLNELLSVTPMIADTGSYTILVTATDAAGATAIDTFTLVVEGYPTAIENLNENIFDVSLYPNPTRGIVTMDIKSPNQSDIDLAVMDITGKLVLRKQYPFAESISFNLSDNVSGMYFVKIKVGDEQIIKKLILDKK